MADNGTAASEKILTSVLGRGQSAFGGETVLFDIADWDSLKHIQLVIEIENHLGTGLDVGDIEALITVDDLRRLLSRKPAS